MKSCCFCETIHDSDANFFCKKNLDEETSHVLRKTKPDWCPLDLKNKKTKKEKSKKFKVQENFF